MECNFSTLVSSFPIYKINVQWSKSTVVYFLSSYESYSKVARFLSFYLSTASSCLALSEYHLWISARNSSETALLGVIMVRVPLWSKVKHRGNMIMCSKLYLIKTIIHWGVIIIIILFRLIWLNFYLTSACTDLKYGKWSWIALGM